MGRATRKLIMIGGYRFNSSYTSLTAPVMNIAHRGARAFAPENTLAAFAKAKIFGCRMFELDVQLSKDGVLIVHHDENLLRCTDVKLKFPERCHDHLVTFTYDELMSLDVGSWYIEQLALPAEQRQAFLQTLTADERTQYVSPEDERYYASGEVKLPSLKEALKLAERLDMLVNIELKMSPAEYPDYAPTVVKLVEDLGMQQRVLISSFEHGLLQQVRQLSQIIPTAVLTGDLIENVVAYLQSLAVDAYHPNCYKTSTVTGTRLLNLDDIQTVRDAGFAVNVWTCNNPLDMRQLLREGATGLISDFPNRVQAVLGR